MQLTNDWIEQGKIEGRTEGRTEGRMEGRRELLARQLRRRVGAVPPELLDQIARLSDSRIDDLGEALFDFQNIADAQTWLNHA